MDLMGEDYVPPIDAPGANGGLGYIAGYYSSEHEYPNGQGEHASPFSNV